MHLKQTSHQWESYKNIENGTVDVLNCCIPLSTVIFSASFLLTGRDTISIDLW
jgi:hypothetical protein